jgi:SNF2 family DNA or RNA helicase
MIPKRTVRMFLKRPLDDNRFYKKLTTAELDKAMSELPVRPPIWNKLEKHQRVGFLLGARYRRHALYYDTGMGKTMLSIALTRYFQKLGQVKCTLVLVPNKINKAEWRREIKKHCPSLVTCILHGSSEQKWRQLRQAQDAGIVVETYAGLVRMLCVLQTIKRKNKRPKTALRPAKKMVAEFVNRFDGLILDESTVVKRKGVLVYRICRQISKAAQIVFALTGTPFGKDPTDLWSQMYLVDRGETLGTTLGLFRAAFFTERKNYWGGTDYTFKKSKRAVLNRMLAHRSIRYEVDEADLPKLIPIVKEVALPADAQTYVQKAQEVIRASQGNYREMRNAFLRMRQLSSGFLGYHDDEAGVKAQYEFPANPKLDLLLSLIESIRAEHKIIVFYEFTFTSDMIARSLKEMKIGYARLYSKTKDADELLERFDSDPKCRVLIMQNQMGFGPNLQAARYGIYMESPVSPIVRKQTRRRFERQRSTHDKVFQYDLITRGTYDLRILDALASGEDLFRQIIDGKAPA